VQSRRNSLKFLPALFKVSETSASAPTNCPPTEVVPRETTTSYTSRERRAGHLHPAKNRRLSQALEKGDSWDFLGLQRLTKKRFFASKNAVLRLAKEAVRWAAATLFFTLLWTYNEGGPRCVSPSRRSEGTGKPQGQEWPQVGWHPPAKHLTPEGRIKDRRKSSAKFMCPPARVVRCGMAKG
jgi:hypothetical protein